MGGVLVLYYGPWDGWLFGEEYISQHRHLFDEVGYVNILSHEGITRRDYIDALDHMHPW